MSLVTSLSCDTACVPKVNIIVHPQQVKHGTSQLMFAFGSSLLLHMCTNHTDFGVVKPLLAERLTTK